jgi:hypothetical protein
MAAMLQLYRQKGVPNPDRFMKNYHTQLEHLVGTTIEQLNHDVPPLLQTATDILGIFRYVSHFMLEQLLNDEKLSGYADEYDLADALTTSYVLRRDNNTALLCNDNHRILALRLRQDPQNAQLAQTFCESYLKATDVRIPERWAIEYFYQFLQERAGEIETQEQRASLKREFFEQTVPYVLTLLITGRKLQGAKRNLNTLLDGDEEFKFVVNYFLRKRAYNDAPYNALRQKIDQFFSSQAKVKKNG